MSAGKKEVLLSDSEFSKMPLTPALSPLLRRGEREKPNKNSVEIQPLRDLCCRPN
jgi:hypothetical protein